MLYQGCHIDFNNLRKKLRKLFLEANFCLVGTLRWLLINFPCSNFLNKKISEKRQKM